MKHLNLIALNQINMIDVGRFTEWLQNKGGKVSFQKMKIYSPIRLCKLNLLELAEDFDLIHRTLTHQSHSALIVGDVDGFIDWAQACELLDYDQKYQILRIKENPFFLKTGHSV